MSPRTPPDYFSDRVLSFFLGYEKQEENIASKDIKNMMSQDDGFSGPDGRVLTDQQVPLHFSIPIFLGLSLGSDLTTRSLVVQGNVFFLKFFPEVKNYTAAAKWFSGQIINRNTPTNQVQNFTQCGF